MVDVVALGAPKTLATSAPDGEAVLALRIKAVDTKLQMESISDDIFESLGSTVVPNSQKKIAVPNSIFMKLNATPTGASQTTVAMLRPLRGDVGFGSPTIGSELTQDLLYSSFYYGEYWKSVASTNYGRNHNELEKVFGVFSEIQPQLSTYFKELHGRRIREALFQVYDSVLVGDTSSPVYGAPSLNPNWFIHDTAIGSQPTWIGSEASADFQDNIGEALQDAIAGGIDLNYLVALDYYASNVLKIDPIYVNGQKTYVFTCPSPQLVRLRDPSVAGSLGASHQAVWQNSSAEMSWPGAVGRVGAIMVVEDERYPELVVADAAGAKTLTAAYLNPGNDDDRTRAAWTAGESGRADMGFLLGAAALCEWNVKPLHFETEEQNYGHDKGTGAFGESGIQLVRYTSDDDTSDVNYTGVEANGTRYLNKGSIVCPLTTKALTA
jgi:hypothetical protein